MNTGVKIINKTDMTPDLCKPTENWARWTLYKQ